MQDISMVIARTWSLNPLSREHVQKIANQLIQARFSCKTKAFLTRAVQPDAKVQIPLDMREAPWELQVLTAFCVQDLATFTSGVWTRLGSFYKLDLDRFKSRSLPEPKKHSKSGSFSDMERERLLRILG